MNVSCVCENECVVLVTVFLRKMYVEKNSSAAKKYQLDLSVRCFTFVARTKQFEFQLVFLTTAMANAVANSTSYTTADSASYITAHSATKKRS